jgi:FKBP-type peptidyl-prolyl cis-trans isomerase
MELMAEGDRWRVYIPYELAYGEPGYPPKIPPYSPVIYELEIIEVKNGRGKPVEAARQMFDEARALTKADLVNDDETKVKKAPKKIENTQNEEVMEL